MRSKVISNSSEERWRAFFNLESEELEARTGYSRKTVYNIRRRGATTDRARKTFAAAYGISIAELKEGPPGKNATSPRMERPVRTAIHTKGLDDSEPGLVSYGANTIMVGVYDTISPHGFGKSKPTDSTGVVQRHISGEKPVVYIVQRGEKHDEFHPGDWLLVDSTAQTVKSLASVIASIDGGPGRLYRTVLQDDELVLIQDGYRDTIPFSRWKLLGAVTALIFRLAR